PQQKEPPAGTEAPPTNPAPPDDPLPAGALNRFGTLKLRGCRGPLVFSPDGKYIVAAGRQAADHVLVFDVQTGREVRAINGRSTLRRLAFSPNGKYLAAVGNGSSANSVWDFESGQ